jgi:hypothetical protein
MNNPMRSKEESMLSWQDTYQAMAHPETLTLFVDKIPGLIVGNPDEPPGHVMIVDGRGRPAQEITTLKMPYDIAITPEGNFLVNIIRARAVREVSPSGEKLAEQPVGGYPCSLELLPDHHILVAAGMMICQVLSGSSMVLENGSGPWKVCAGPGRPRDWQAAIP